MNIINRPNNKKIIGGAIVGIPLIFLLTKYYPFIWAFIDSLPDSTAKFLLATLCIVVVMHLFSLPWLVKKIYRQELQKSSCDYCSRSVKFKKEYPEWVKSEPKDANIDSSDLWYILINTRRYGQFSSELQTKLQWLNSNKNDQDKLSEIEYWSLQGEAEILLKFRCSSEQRADDIYKNLLAEFEGRGFLEKTLQSPKGLTLINCTKEIVRDFNSTSVVFNKGKYRLNDIIPADFRYKKVFIKYQFDMDERDETLPEVLAMNLQNKEYGIYIDSVANSMRKDGPQYILIEATFPCGCLNELKELSKYISTNHLNDKVSKETYTAFEGVLIKPRT